MNYIDYSAVQIDIDDFFKKVALIAHNCYQAVGKSPDELFVSNIIRNKHLAMTEHYHFHFLVNEELGNKFIAFNNPFIVISKLEDKYLLTLSIRPILENYESNNELFLPLISTLDENIKVLFNVEDKKYDDVEKIDLKELPLDIYFKVRGRHHFLTVMIVTDRGVTHELVRHRPCSFAQESTRYCNYSKNKFNHSVSFIKPLDYDLYHDIYDEYYQKSEDGYFKMLEAGATPDIARSLLPNGLKTSIAVTCSEEEWNHIFDLRLDRAAHKDMRYTMILVQHALKGEIL